MITSGRTMFDTLSAWMGCGNYGSLHGAHGAVPCSSSGMMMTVRDSLSEFSRVTLAGRSLVQEEEVCGDALAKAGTLRNGSGGGGIGDASVQAGTLRNGSGGGGCGDASVQVGFGQGGGGHGGGCSLEAVCENSCENIGGCYTGDNDKIKLCLDELIDVEKPSWENLCIDDETAKCEQDAWDKISEYNQAGYDFFFPA